MKLQVQWNFLMTRFLKEFLSIRSILLLTGVIILGGCNKKVNMKSEEKKDSKFSINILEGNKIVFESIDSLLVIEFSNGVSNDRKQEVLDDFNLRLLPIRPRKSLAIQSIDKSTLVLGITKGKSSSIRHQIIKKYPNEINGILPALKHENSSEPLYLRPTTFGVIFYLDVPHDSAMTLLHDYNLSIPDSWIENHFFPYYVMRLAYINIAKHAGLFDIIQSISDKQEVYSAFPLHVNGGYSLPRGLNPTPGKFKNVRKTAPYIKKLNGNLRRLYWTWKTAPMSVLKELAKRGGIPLVQDSIKVEVKLDKINLDEAHQLLLENRVRLLGAIKDVGNSLAFTGIVKWQDIEGFAGNKNVQWLSLPFYLTIEGGLDTETIPPPPPKNP
ncbi:hypothetical protein IIC38_20280 [candidate division KSB1 bacterium]|nr:hypothetical protein [candidate division KSB1 bacterium]